MATYVIDKKRFVFEQFDKEMVLINLEDGLYYSVSDSGTEIIDLLEKGLSVERAIAHLSQSYEDTDEIPDLVLDFVNDCVRQSILIAASAPESGGDSEAAPVKPGTVRFATPVISRFDDMQEILLLDPIHQVSEQGWPHQ
jgi:hypothetical protein